MRNITTFFVITLRACFSLMKEMIKASIKPKDNVTTESRMEEKFVEQQTESRGYNFIVSRRKA